MLGRTYPLLGPISFYPYLQYAITHSPNGMCPYFLHLWIRGGKNKEKWSSFLFFFFLPTHTPLFKGTLRDPPSSLSHTHLSKSLLSWTIWGFHAPFLSLKSLLKLQKVSPSRLSKTLSLPLIPHTSHIHCFVKNLKVFVYYFLISQINMLI